MQVVIIEYNAGNSYSLFYALQRLGCNAEITSDKEKIKKADKVFFPGQGEASTAMKFLRQNQIDFLIKNLQQPILGICVGMQLMCKYSQENNTSCFEIFDTVVQKFTVPDKIPQMGWNQLFGCRTDLFKNINNGSYVYYANSFYVPITEYSIAKTNYHIDFSASIHKNNFYGIQFHPEKSGQVGQQILKNFLDIC